MSDKTDIQRIKSDIRLSGGARTAHPRKSDLIWQSSQTHSERTTETNRPASADLAWEGVSSGTPADSDLVSAQPRQARLMSAVAVVCTVSALVVGGACVGYGLYRFYLNPAQNPMFPAFIVALGGIITVAVLCPVTFYSGQKWRDARLGNNGLFESQEKDVFIYIILSLTLAAGAMLCLTGMYYWATPKAGENRRSFGGYLIVLGLIYEGFVLPPIVFIFYPLVKHLLFRKNSIQDATRTDTAPSVSPSRMDDASSTMSVARPNPLPPLLAEPEAEDGEWPQPLSNQSSYPSTSGGGDVLERLRLQGNEKPIKWTKSKTFLGKGAFGFVSLGMTDSGQLVAIKQIPFIQTELDRVHGVAKEVGLMRSLVHPNIVQYLGAEVTETSHNLTLSIVMEYMAGGSIATLLQKFGPFQETVVRAYTRQIVLGLEYLHNSNVIHRDIKGGNVLVNRAGVAKLADFGASKAVADICRGGSESNTQLQTFCGTPWWAAPEVVRNDGYGRKADVWSVGATVFEMAMGEPPFFSYNAMGAILQIGNLEHGIDPPDTLSDDGKAFMALIMQCEPTVRPTASRLLLHPYLNPDEVFADSLPTIPLMKSQNNLLSVPGSPGTPSSDPRLSADLLRSTSFTEGKDGKSKGKGKKKGKSKRKNKHKKDTGQARDIFPEDSAFAELDALAPGLADALLQVKLQDPPPVPYDSSSTLSPRQSNGHTSAPRDTNSYPLSFVSSGVVSSGVASSAVSIEGWVASDERMKTSSSDVSRGQPKEDSVQRFVGGVGGRIVKGSALPELAFHSDALDLANGTAEKRLSPLPKLQ